MEIDMENIKFVIEKSERIEKLISALYEKMPEIESSRGILVTESYKATENLPVIKRRSAAFSHILRNIPIVIRDNELIVGSATVAPRGCQVFPEYSYEWLPIMFLVPSPTSKTSVFLPGACNSTASISASSASFPEVESIFRIL